MAVSLLDKNHDTDYCTFSYDNWDLDKEYMPNLKTPGKNALSTIKSCSQGSIAIGTDGTLKILTGNNEWIDY